MSELEETKTFTCMNCNSEIEIDTISGEALLIIKDLERQLVEARKLENRPYIGDMYKSKINENQLLTVCGLSYNSVTYEYLSTNVNMKRYKCQDITSIRRFLEITEGKKANE